MIDHEEEILKKELSKRTAFEVSTIAQDIHPVTPMASGPTGSLYYLDAVYVRNSVRFFDRDEFYAYDDLLQSYLGKLYPKFLIRSEKNT